jgi:hypothetical protein
MAFLSKTMTIPAGESMSAPLEISSGLQGGAACDAGRLGCRSIDVLDLA